MRIACPNCRAQYEVPDAVVASARVVRCVRCAQEWSPVAVSDGPEQQGLRRAAEPPQPPAPPPAAPIQASDWPVPEQLAPSPPAPPAFSFPPAAGPHVAAVAAPPRRPLGPVLAWAASLLLLAGTAWSAYAWKAQVMLAWPPSERAYAALRLAGPPAVQAPAARAPAPRTPAH